MAVNWMDNFNIYGTDAVRTGRLFNGVYASGSWIDLLVDPDVTAGGGRVLASTNEQYSNLRKVLPVARTTFGVALRLWLNALPVANAVANVAAFQDASGNNHIYIVVDTSGYIKAYRQDIAGPVLLGTSAGPAIIANAWQHIETKVFIDVAVGTVEVRVEGVPVLVVAAGRTSSNVAVATATVQNITLLGSLFGGNGVNTYLKDYIVWDTTTAFNNSFMGTCQVYKIIPDADVALNWTPFPAAPATGFDKINEVTPDDDTSYISAPFPLPAAYKCSMSDLPVTVTSVRAVMPIHRSRKTDGGDGNLQIGVKSAATTGLGLDRPITTAYTYWWDVFDADPNGGIAWTRLSLNAINLQINRTV